ncbi:makorin, ring finger protein, 4, partial [Silurus meridionalis]
RQFVNGSCSFGQHCFYRHEYPAASSAQVCRYFQKGGCWFGENCRYLHIAGPHRGSSAVRRGSVPVVNTSTLPGHGSASLRGSEPSLFPVFDPFNSGRRGSEPMVTFNWRRRASEPLVTTSSHQQISQRETADIAEEEEHAVLEAGSTGHQQGLFMAYNESKDVVCGICMDKVYEKATARERRFGILPNCSHAFCLGCIMTWRKTKDFQEEVIKACPQCRVRSSFYIPSKYWVCEGEAKEALIASFKEKSSKIKCNFFLRHGCCPFALECIYSH